LPGLDITRPIAGASLRLRGDAIMPPLLLFLTSP